MKEKLQLLSILMFVVGILIIVGLGGKSLGEPNEVYQVYLNGKKIGLIASEQKLLDLIDKEQTSIKEQYKVDKVYPPTGLNIEKIYTYSNKLSDTDDIYNQIKDAEPFTINGYTVTITYPEKEVKNTDDENVDSKSVEDKIIKEPLKIYIFDDDLIKTSLKEVAETFIGKNELKNYEDGTQSEINETGEVITSVYFEETITIKESLVPIKEHIFRDSDELTQYLMYGTNEQQEKYTVKVGEDLHKIANDHKLNIDELLIANPKYPSGNALLSPGETLNVGLINPLVSVTYRKTVVSDVDVPFTTQTVKDDNKYTDFKQTTSAGVKGVSRLTQDVLYVNGEIQTLNITQSKVIKEPIPEVVTVGTKKVGSFVNYNSTTFSSSDFSWPTLSPFMIVSRFAWRGGVFHRGIDIVVSHGYGSPIYAIADGEVWKTGTGTMEGQYVTIKHSETLYSQYMHLSKIGVKVGQKVSREQRIGSMGNSGKGVTGTHLHLGIWTGGAPYLNGSTVVDPCKSVFRC